MTLVNGFFVNEMIDGRLPVCYMIDTSSSTGGTITAGPPEEILKANPTADMAFVYIRFE